jgi:type II secretory pathway component GspD/PulD (secretin)
MTRLSLRGVSRRTGAALAACSLAACTTLPSVGSLPPRTEILRAQTERLESDGAPAVSVVPVNRGMLVVHSVRETLPAVMARRTISVSYPAGENTLDRLVSMLSYSGIRVATRFEQANDADMLRRALPFRAFSGTVAELTSVLQGGMGIVSWWQDGTLFLTDRDRYAFTVPQIPDVIRSITDDLKSMGVSDLTPSLRGGQILFSAPPSLYAEVVRPYIDRIHRNMAMVKVQMAVVSLTLNDSSATGFDWSKLALGFNSSSSTDGTTTSTTSTSSTSTTTSGSAFTVMAGGPLSWATSPTGKLLGVSGAFTVAGAIDYLSKFGTADTKQNVEVHTLSGAQVTLRSGQEIPYVSGVGVNTLGGTSSGSSGALLGSAQTTTVKTGLTIKLTPFYDADTRIVTADLNILVNSLVRFVQLSVGNQVGTITQPQTQEQALNDIVRVLAGNTVVLGGLQVDNANYDNAEPVAIRPDEESSASAAPGGATSVIGHRAQTITKEALFVVVRPTVTVFVEQGG